MLHPRFFLAIPTAVQKADSQLMGEDPRLEIARLKEHLNRVQRVCELHRQLGEDTEFEIRELRRKVEAAKSQFVQAANHYSRLVALIEKSGTEEMRNSVELCDAALKILAKTVLSF